jgi:copper chaperone NosL
MLTAALAVACRSGPSPPAVLDTRNDACATCRMMVSDQRFAAQLVAPNEEPRFFDDLGCLETYLRKTPSLPRGSVVYVADHRTKAWVLGAAAVYTRVEGLEAPMRSPFLAHESGASRAADPDAAAGRPVSVAEVMAGLRLPGS